jgi:hypothetical protein
VVRRFISRGFILPNCVDLGRFQPQERDLVLISRYGLKSAIGMLTVARLATEERYKGIDEVIDIVPRLVRQLPDLRYLIVGDGSDRARLEAKVRSRGLSDLIIFAGRIPEAEKVAHYNLADVYVMPSHGEGFGIALIKAAACGLPVVGSSVDGSREAHLMACSAAWSIPPSPTTWCRPSGQHSTHGSIAPVTSRSRHSALADLGCALTSGSGSKWSLRKRERRNYICLLP